MGRTERTGVHQWLAALEHVCDGIDARDFERFFH
jgi:hypothetical protein